MYVGSCILDSMGFVGQNFDKMFWDVDNQSDPEYDTYKFDYYAFNFIYS